MKKAKKHKSRNPYVLPMRKKKSGKMKSKKDVRKNGKNKQKEYLKEND